MPRSKKSTAAKCYPCGPKTRYELGQLSVSLAVAGRALRAANQLGVIFANRELEAILRQSAGVAAELDDAERQALADEAAGLDSYRFPA